MSELTTKFNSLKISVENEAISFGIFQQYFDGCVDGHLELLQALHWLEKYVQNCWEKSNFTIFDVTENMEKMIEKIYKLLPFDGIGIVWFGGIIPTKNKTDNSLSIFKTAFFNVYLVIAASSKNLSFITQMFSRIFYHLPNSVSFCEAFIENDTLLITSLLAFHQIEKNNPGLSLDYEFVDLFIALVLQFQGNAGNMFLDFLRTEAVMIPFILRSLKYFNGKLQRLKESNEKLRNSENPKLLHNERTLLKRSDESSSNIVFCIDGVDGNHRITLNKRIEAREAVFPVKDNNFDVVEFFHHFYQLVQDAHKQNQFPFKSDALVKCLHNFISYISTGA